MEDKERQEARKRLAEALRREAQMAFPEKPLPKIKKEEDRSPASGKPEKEKAAPAPVGPEVTPSVPAAEDVFTKKERLKIISTGEKKPGVTKLSKRDLKRGIMLAEILGKPRALKAWKRE